MNIKTYVMAGLVFLSTTFGAFAQETCINLNQLDAMAYENSYIKKNTISFEILRDYVKEVHGLSIPEGQFDESVAYFPSDETNPMFIVFYFKDGCVVEKQILPKEEFYRVMDFIKKHKG